MPVIDKPLSEIKPEDLEALVELSVQEGKEIEYKEYLDLSSDASDGKEKLVSEVVSFANARGGDLIVGMADDDGAPKNAAGFPSSKDKDYMGEHHSTTDRPVSPNISV